MARMSFINPSLFNISLSTMKSSSPVISCHFNSGAHRTVVILGCKGNGSGSEVACVRRMEIS